MSVRLAPDTRVLERGRVLVGGSPRRVIRLTPAGRHLVMALQRGVEVATLGDETAIPLVRHLMDAGLVHSATSATAHGIDEVAVVIPARNAAHTLERCLRGFGGVRELIVVDDASSDATAAVASRFAQVAQRDRQGGPGAARNTGLRLVSSPFVCFVDADCEIDCHSISRLLPHFSDHTVGAVAPRIVGGRGMGRRALAQHEGMRSPFDLGSHEGWISPGTRLAFAATAALLVRTEAALAAGGFDEDLVVGEDVDFNWRLRALGWRIRYDPSVRVEHVHRTRIGPFITRRFDYGAAYAGLARRHGSRTSPVYVPASTAIAGVSLAAGFPSAAAVAIGVDMAQLARRLPTARPLRHIVALSSQRHLGAARAAASAVTRAWLPIAGPLAVKSRRARRVVVAAAAASLAADMTRRPRGLNPVRYAVIRAMDNAAYGAGVWRGCIRERTVRPLLPGRVRTSIELQPRGAAPSPQSPPLFSAAQAR